MVGLRRGHRDPELHVTVFARSACKNRFFGRRHSEEAVRRGEVEGVEVELRRSGARRRRRCAEERSAAATAGLLRGSWTPVAGPTAGS